MIRNADSGVNTIPTCANGTKRTKNFFQDALAKGIDNKQKTGNSHFVHHSKSQSTAFHLITKAKGIPVPILVSASTAQENTADCCADKNSLDQTEHHQNMFL